MSKIRKDESETQVNNVLQFLGENIIELSKKKEETFNFLDIPATDIPATNITRKIPAPENNEIKQKVRKPYTLA